MTSNNALRATFFVDGVFEASFGLLLVVGGLAGWLDAVDFPVARWVVVAGGFGFVAAGISVPTYFARAGRRMQLEIAIGNLLLAAAGYAWLLAAGGFSKAGTGIVAAGATGLGVVAVLELRALLGRPERLGTGPTL